MSKALETISNLDLAAVHGGDNKPPAHYNGQDLRNGRSTCGDDCKISVATYMGRHGAPERINVQFATPDFFQMLGVPLALGRTFIKSSDQTETIILGDKFWRSHFHADPNVLGQTVSIDSGYLYVVVGVLSPGFDFFGRGEVDIWRPIFVDEGPWNDERRSQGGWFWSIAHLKPGASVEQAQSDLNVVAHQRIVPPRSIPWWL